MKQTPNLLLSLTFFTFAAVSAEEMSPQATEQWQPIPSAVSPYPVPSDAVALFDGSNLDAWKGKKGPATWKVSDKIMTIAPGEGGLVTKQSFCDIQLHMEWRSPANEKEKKGQHLGNSGVYLQGRYEVQILNSFENQTYVNGQAASIYKQSPPLVNAMEPTGKWNTYDILFTAPRFAENDTLISPAYVTVLHNGVLVQHHYELKGPTRYKGLPEYKAHGCAPIFLQDHGSEVSFRNIWVREL